MKKDDIVWVVLETKPDNSVEYINLFHEKEEAIECFGKILKDTYNTSIEEVLKSYPEYDRADWVELVYDGQLNLKHKTVELFTQVVK